MDAKLAFMSNCLRFKSGVIDWSEEKLLMMNRGEA
jgi:hypothetical protein